MVICAIYGCNNNNDKNRKQNKVLGREKLLFFRFPKDETMKNVWIQKCKRKDKFNEKNAFICSKHFTSDQYARNLQHELLNYSPKNSRKLKPNAIPTEELPLISKDANSKRQENYERRNTKKNCARNLQNPSK